MSAFGQLDTRVQSAIVQQLGWTSLRPAQEQAIGPVLSGEHVVLVAPTAGGKTEAALFPLLSRAFAENWGPGAILWITPLRSLVNNLRDRLEPLLASMGCTLHAWHGDTTESARTRIRRDPPEVLLTTPESIEAMLISRRTQGDFFANVRAVVIDEVHAFAGSDRGWHLLGVLERIETNLNHAIQRIGLSATVANPQEMLAWMASGPGQVVAPDVSARQADVQVDWVASLENAAKVLHLMHGNERRLAFCDSRVTAEKLTQLLTDLGTPTWILHGSLSRDQREMTERRLAEGDPGVVVATSALELGVDIGALDRVFQIDAPFTVASFMQRMGRTGRRDGKVPNTTFLCVSRPGLLRACGIVDAWKKGQVEPVVPPPMPLHIYAQQMLAVALELPGVNVREFHRRLRPFREVAGISQEMAEDLMFGLLENNWLYTDGRRVSVGVAGEKKFGGKNFLELMSSFTSPPVVNVIYQKREIGSVGFASIGGKDSVLLLGGRNWRVTGVDWVRKRAWVEPTADGGKTFWRGVSAEVSDVLATSIGRVLCAETLSPEGLSKRAVDAMEAIREDFGCLPLGTNLLSRSDDSATLWTFAGLAANSRIADGLRFLVGRTAKADALCVEFTSSHPARDLDQLRDSHDEPPPNLRPPWLESLKFRELVPPPMLRHMVIARAQGENFRQVLAQPLSEANPALSSSTTKSML